MLTKEQLLTSTEEDFMNNEQLDYMRNLLIEMRDVYRVKNPVMLQLLTTPNNRCSDEADQARQEEDLLLNLKMRSLESDLLSDIEKALYKVDTGNYGYCEKSGEPIDIRRLLAQPTSNTTIEEQTRQELKRRGHFSTLNGQA